MHFIWVPSQSLCYYLIAIVQIILLIWIKYQHKILISLVATASAWIILIFQFIQHLFKCISNLLRSPESRSSCYPLWDKIELYMFQPNFIKTCPSIITCDSTDEWTLIIILISFVNLFYIQLFTGLKNSTYYLHTTEE